jgi:restriction endonuclease S subunit
MCSSRALFDICVFNSTPYLVRSSSRQSLAFKQNHNYYLICCSKLYSSHISFRSRYHAVKNIYNSSFSSSESGINYFVLDIVDT